MGLSPVLDTHYKQDTSLIVLHYCGVGRKAVGHVHRLMHIKESSSLIKRKGLPQCC